MIGLKRTDWKEVYPDFEPNREDTQYVLSVSYGKDSLACIGACILLGWRIDRIVHAEVWATDDIPAELPPMWNFKEKADKIIKDMIGIEVGTRCQLEMGILAESTMHSIKFF